MALEDGLSWDDLRLFLAVAREGSLSRAAKVLGTTQPTVSRRLAALEDDLGTPLFERTAQGATPTARGRTMMGLAETMARAAASVEQLARSGAREMAGRVTVACGPTVGRVVARHAASMLALHPEIELEVITGLSDVNLERGDADIALRNRRPRSRNLYTRRIGRPTFAIYGGTAYVHDHPEAHDDRRYGSCAWVGYHRQQQDVPSARWLAERLAEHDRQPHLGFNSSHLIVEAVAHGAGLAVLPMREGDGDPRVMRVSPPLEDLTFEAFVVTHVRSRQLPRVRFVVEALVDVLQEALAR